jgi:hypothetical protein
MAERWQSVHGAALRAHVGIPQILLNIPVYPKGHVRRLRSRCHKGGTLTRAQNRHVQARAWTATSDLVTSDIETLYLLLQNNILYRIT